MSNPNEFNSQAQISNHHLLQSHGDAPTEQPTSLSQLERGMKETTDAAVAEGEQNVKAAKAIGVGYLDKAKSIAENALETAQSYMPERGSNGGNANGKASDVVSSIQATAASAVETTVEYIQPHIETAFAAAQPHIDRAKETAREYLGTATRSSSSPN